MERRRGMVRRVGVGRGGAMPGACRSGGPRSTEIARFVRMPRRTARATAAATPTPTLMATAVAQLGREIENLLEAKAQLGSEVQPYNT
eukprot:scaffold97542_cov27-Phaeocystis_antarctica.AAC.1